MRLQYIVLISATALLAPIDAALVARDSEVAATNSLIRSFHAGTQDVPINRFLRTHNKDDEDRGLDIKSIGVIDKLSTSTNQQSQQIRTWLEKMEPPGSVFKLLKLDKEADNLLANPQLKVWINYATKYKDQAKGNPFATHTSLIDVLMKNYKPEDLATVVNTAKQNPNTKLMANYVQGELLGKWATDNKPAAYVLKLLGTSADETKLVNTLYLKKLKEVQDQQNQQIRTWLEKMEPPGSVFKLLKLDKEADNLLANPQLKVWINYATKYKDQAKGNPFATHTSLIDVLMKNYKPEDLATVVNTAKQNPNTKLMANYVEGELINKWVIAGKPLAYVSKMLGTSKEEKVLVHKIYLAKLEKVRVD